MAKPQSIRKMPKTGITLIIPFFGNPPSWMPFFLKGCYANAEVSFLIFSDCMQAGRYRNVNVINFRLEDLKNLAAKKLKMPICLESSYKICDLRPAFGIIFEDYLKDSRFWGTCDLDVLFGNIRKFITDDLLNNYDVITAKREYLIGHFTLYRNSAKVNNLFKKSADYQQVFTSPRSYAFDECNFLWWKLLAGQSIFETPSAVESMSHVVKRMEVSGSIRAYFKTHVIEQDKLDALGRLVEFPNTLLWNDGTLKDLETGNEYLSFHFHFLKKESTFSIPILRKIPSRFQVSKAGFIPDYQLIEEELTSC